MTRLMNNQKGFTLIELIIALAIASVIGVAATMTAHQLITIPVISNDSNTAINQVRNAVNWINRDAVQAQTVNATLDDPKFLELTRTDFDDSELHTITYSLEDKELWRDYDGDVPMLIAQYIDLSTTNCSWDDVGKVLTVNITVQVGTRTEARTFEVKPRPD